MIEKIIEFSAQNRVLVLLGVAALCVLAVHTLSRSGSTRCPTSRTPRSSSTRAGTAPPTSSRTRSPTRSSRRCSARRRSRRSAASPTSASPSSTSSSRTAPTSTGRARGCSSTCRRSSRGCPRACRPSSARTPPASAGSSSTRWWTATGKHSLDELRSYQDWTLRYALQAVPGRGRGRLDRRLRQAVPDHRRPQPPGRVRRSRSPTVVAAIRALEQRGRRPAARVERHRVHGARARLRPQRSRTSSRSSSRSAAGGVPVLLRTWRGSSSGPEMRRGVADLDGLGDDVGGIVVMRHGENALNVIERVKEKLDELEPSLPAGRRDRHHLRPLRPDRPRHRHAEARADRRDDHRLARHPGLPLAHPLGDRADRHHPDLGAARLHPAVLHGRHRQHHVAGRHRHLHRRAGGRRHRRGGERLQQDPPLGGRAAARATSTRCASRR